MREHAVFLVHASFVVLADEGSRPPVFAKILGVLKKMRLAPEVLPVVGVLALRLVVVLRERAPLRFEVEEVKILVVRVLVNQRDLHVSLRVRERTEVPVLALRQVVREKRAELCLVLLGMVEPLHLVVCVRADVAHRALRRLGEYAQLRRIALRVPPTAVFYTVEELAVFVVVLVLVRALFDFKRV